MAAVEMVTVTGKKIYVPEDAVAHHLECGCLFVGEVKPNEVPDVVETEVADVEVKVPKVVKTPKK